MWIVGLIIAGLIVGALGRLFHPGRDPMGLLTTIGVGIAAVIVAGLLIGHHGFWTFLFAVLVGVVLVAVIGRVLAARGPRTAQAGCAARDSRPRGNRRPAVSPQSALRQKYV